MTSQSKNSRPERVIEMMEDLANRNNPRMAPMTEPTQAQPFEEQRVQAIARNRYERTTGKSWDDIFRDAPELEEGWIVGARKDLAADPATAALAEAVELLGSWDTEDDYTFGTAVHAFLARHEGYHIAEIGKMIKGGNDVA